MTFLQWVNVLTPVVVACVGWLLKNSFGRLTDRLERADERIGQLESWRTRVAVSLDEKVSREEWVRETARVRQTLERLIEGQARLEGKLDAGTRIAAAIEHLSQEQRNANG